MNTKDPWTNLGRAVRAQARPGAPLPTEAPYGFHSRVLARVRDARGIPAEAWLQLALRALPFGAAILLACWLALPSLTTSPEPEPDLATAAFEEVLQ